MPNDLPTLDEVLDAVCAKRLSAVEVDPDVSNQREFNGTLALREFFGDERIENGRAKAIRLSDDPDEPWGSPSPVTYTWYDARELHPTRSEYRLYCSVEPLVGAAAAGDLLTLVRTRDGEILFTTAEAGSSAEAQLINLLGIDLDEQGAFTIGTPADLPTGAAVAAFLDVLGVPVPAAATGRLDEMLARFSDEFPTSRVFSTFTFETLEAEGAVVLDDPDRLLIDLVDREEALFRELEAELVGRRLADGFLHGGEPDVDGFIRFSLSVQNRRKSRAGHALEHHVRRVLEMENVEFEHQGRTEHGCRPDFLFPGSADYHDAAFPGGRLRMLATKTSCKDRWRQVLSEAARIDEKHLLTLEPAISAGQLEEMRANRLRLVVPIPLQATYVEEQQRDLVSLVEFIELVRQIR